MMMTGKLFVFPAQMRMGGAQVSSHDCRNPLLCCTIADNMVLAGR